MQVWRISPAKYAQAAFRGTGGLHYAARWHQKGTRIVYTSQSLSLAALEFFVHLVKEQLPARLVAISANIPDSVSVISINLASLPKDWRSYPAPESLQQIGSRWIESGQSAVLSVPSAVIPSERNYLLNPAHPQFSTIAISKPELFHLDWRMWK